MPRRLLIVVAAFVGLAAFAGGAAFAQTGPLLQPGEPYPDSTPEPIHLHPPLHKPAEKKPRSTSQTAKEDNSTDNATAPQIDLIHPPRHHHTASVASTAPATNEPVTVPFSLDGAGRTLPPAGAQSKGTTRSPSAGGPIRQASIAPSAAVDRPNLKKRGAILFERGASSPSPAQYRGVKVLADSLNSALEKGAAAIQLEAYGGAPGDKSSDARRLSLRRALAVRQLLIDDGVPSARIDVRAMGGADDKDTPDRVDVFIRAG
jgi:outer membrane protein OmpA-like peptidoglycan-associated protein